MRHICIYKVVPPLETAEELELHYPQLATYRPVKSNVMLLSISTKISIDCCKLTQTWTKHCPTIDELWSLYSVTTNSPRHRRVCGERHQCSGRESDAAWGQLDQRSWSTTRSTLMHIHAQGMGLSHVWDYYWNCTYLCFKLVPFQNNDEKHDVDTAMENRGRKYFV